MSKAETIKLKPCPFCGEEEVVAYSCLGMVHPKEKPLLWLAECQNKKCGAAGPPRRTKQGVIKAWNRRPICSHNAHDCAP